MGQRVFVPSRGYAARGNRINGVIDQVASSPAPSINPLMDGIRQMAMMLARALARQPETPSELQSSFTPDAVMAPIEMGAKAAAGAGQKAIRAYHGSPHDFDKFSLSKIGTGEGAQAYGHGLYFAENPQVAKEYQKRLAGRQVDYNSPASEHARAYFDAANGDREKARQALLRQAANYEGGVNQKHADKFKEAAAIVAELPEGAAPGRMYEVAIKADPGQMLDWDAPIAEQSEYVRQALAKAGIPVEADIYAGFKVEPTATGRSFRVTQGGYEYGTYRTQAAAEARRAELARSHSDAGKTAYNRAGGNTLYPSLDKGEAAQKLREAGIPGIKYLDGVSRKAGEGSRNYVVFDDSLIEILRKYGLVPPLAAMGNEDVRAKILAGLSDAPAQPAQPPMQPMPAHTPAPRQSNARQMILQRLTEPGPPQLMSSRGGGNAMSPDMVAALQGIAKRLKEGM